MGKNQFALVRDKINLLLVSRQFKLFKKLKKTLLLAQTLKMCFFRVNSQNYARPCAATEKATLIKKWDFGIGVLKKCGPTCSNFCPSKISPPYSVSMCVSPLTNTSSMCVQQPWAVTPINICYHTGQQYLYVRIYYICIWGYPFVYKGAWRTTKVLPRLGYD